MCQSGICKYEKGCGENVGDCTLGIGIGPWPQDAYCIVRDDEIDAYLSKWDELVPTIKISKKKGRFRILELT